MNSMKEGIIQTSARWFDNGTADVAILRSNKSGSWQNESQAYNSETTEEEIVPDAQLNTSTSGEVCEQTSCPGNTFTCQSTTKIFQTYFCSGSGCAYQVISLYYSTDCAYGNPGFDAGGNPLVVISETDVDSGSAQNEFLEFLALQPLELSGFTVLKNNVPVITFPSPFLLNGAARVYTGSGSETLTTTYLNLGSPIWNEPNTIVTLVNPFGIVVATQTFDAGGA